MLAFHQNAIDSLNVLQELHMKWKYGTEMSIWINVYTKVKFRERTSKYPCFPILPMKAFCKKLSVPPSSPCMVTTVYHDFDIPNSAIIRLYSHL